ncbi:MAG: ABC transporter ATP-binding protein [Chloroflexi bacterium]|nr:ABC transporter ATP-binding protein [Chloroflexota bacterium]
MTYAIETHALTKYYGKKVGCQDITLAIEEGQLFGLLGQNGAGKSTFVKMLIGLIHPTSGEARLLGRPLSDVANRSQVGFLPENFKYQEWLSGRELLRYHAALIKMGGAPREKRITEVLDTVKMDAAADAKVRTYSKGMQQRLGLACAILAKPRLLFLDEPTSALDPLGRVDVREILVGLKAEGTTVFLNSHLLSEIETVCDEVAIMKSGGIVTTGSLERLLAGKIELLVRTSELRDEVRERILRASLPLSRNGNRFLLEVDDENAVAEIARTIVVSGAELYELSQHHRSLEELFLEVVKEGE